MIKRMHVLYQLFIMSSQNIKPMPGYSSSLIGSLKLIPYQEIQIYQQSISSSKDLFDKLIDQDSCLFQEKSSIRTNYYININPQQKEHQGCKCSKISCLKMYCECFSKERVCNDKCECTNCCNTQDCLDQIHNAQEKINFKHPGIFKEVPALISHRRCTCKKSGCHKKYCQCFRSRVKCTQYCSCLDCQNGKPHQHEDFFDSSLRIEVNA